ncbi:MAG: glycosyltransferase family 2 protein [Nitrospinota bacterium]
MSKVSVIIPTYNRAHLLGRAIESVLEQTFQDFELIVVDDASTDGTGQLIRTFGDKRIRYIQHDMNKGSNASRNTGLRHARGEYVAFLDSDDEWLPEKLEKQLKVFQRGSEKLGLVSTRYSDEYLDPDEPFMPHYRGNIFHKLLTENIIGSASTPLIKTTCFEKAGLFDETMPASQDWDMWIRIAQHFEFDFVPEILARFYFQPDSISRNIESIKRAHMLIYKKYSPFIEALPKSIQIEHYFYEGRYFLWRRDIPESCRYFIKTIRLNPLMLFKIIYYYARKTMIKVLKFTRKVNFTPNDVTPGI